MPPSRSFQDGSFQEPAFRNLPMEVTSPGPYRNPWFVLKQNSILSNLPATQTFSFKDVKTPFKLVLISRKQNTVISTL